MKKNLLNIINSGFYTSFKSKYRVNYFVMKYNLILVILSLIIISIILSRGIFIKPSNIINLILQNSIIGVLAMGQFLVILTGGIDLSVGSCLSASSMLCALCFSRGYGILFSVLISIIFATSLGFANGLIITKGKIPPFIATLGMMEIARSLARLINYGSPIWEIPEYFNLFWKPLGPIPILLIIWGIVFFSILILVNRTYYGRYIYAIGMNKDASRLSGVRVERIKLLVYTIMGTICGIASIMFIGRLQYASPDSGRMYNLDSIAAVLIGGTSLSGGKGAASGVLLGMIVIGVITNLMNIMNINLFWQNGIKGMIILAIIAYKNYLEVKVK